MFKTKLKYIELLMLIVQTGYEKYILLNNDLQNEFNYDTNYFYIIYQMVYCFIFQRMLKFQKIFDNKDFFRDIIPIITNNINTEYKDDLQLAMIQIKNEISEIWKNDSDTNENNEIFKTANYLVNEILECNDNENIMLKSYFENYFINCHFENKKIINKYKFID